MDFKELFVLLKAGTKAPPPYATLAAAKAAEAVTLNVGVFINTVISFLLVSISVFMVVKGINMARRAPAPAAAAPPAPTASEALLMEIRDLLKVRR